MHDSHSCTNVGEALYILCKLCSSELFLNVNNKLLNKCLYCRLWGDHGQSALESAQVCLVNATATGTETLKNLILPGIIFMLESHPTRYNDFIIRQLYIHEIHVLS